MNQQSQAVSALVNLLETGDEADRCYAARALGVFADESAVDALIPRLRDKDIDACVDAAEALREIGSTKALPALIESLENESSGEICTAVVTALNRLGGQQASDALLKVAAERPEGLDWDDDWDTWWDVQLEAVRALGNAKEERAIDTLIDIMDNHEHQDIESEVLKVLAQIEGKGTETLIQRLAKAEPRSRRRAAKYLGRIESKEVARALGQALKDEEAEVRAAAVEALAEQNATHYLPAILLLLRDESEEARSAAVKSASRLASRAAGSDEVQEHLLTLLNDPSTQVRSESFNTLAREIQPRTLKEESLAAISASLNDSDPSTATAACNLLGRNGATESASELTAILSRKEAHPMLRREAALALGRIGHASDSVIEALTETVGDQEQSVRLAALTVLMDLAQATTDPEANQGNPLDIVIEALEGKIEIPTPQEEVDEDSTAEALEATAEEETAEIEPESEQASNVVELDTQMRDKDDLKEEAEPEIPLPTAPPRVAFAQQSNAASTLDAIAMDNVEATLELQEEEEEEQIDEEAMRYLDVAERQKKEAERMLVKRSFDVALDVRRLAARALAGSNRQEVVEALRNVMQREGDEELASEAISALGEIAAKAPSTPELMDCLGPLIAQLSIGDRDRRLACARTLGRLRNRAAIAPLMGVLDDEIKDVRIEAIHAIADLVLEGLDPIKEDHMVLEEVTPIEITTRFLECMKDEANGVRLAAAQSLARLVKLEGLTELTEQAVDRMIDAAFIQGGQQTRPMGKVIRDTDLDLGSTKLLAQLEEADDSADRRFVIEMLEELFKPQPGQEAA